jgi:hypothetical protein
MQRTEIFFCYSIRQRFVFYVSNYSFYFKHFVYLLIKYKLNFIEIHLMKTILQFILFALFCQGSFSQSDSILKFILVPHPRSEDRVHQTVLPAIEKIDFTKYDMILLGGDLTYYTSISRVSMEYCDSLFDLGSSNTLWTMGNHDLNNPNLVKEYTGRQRFYTYYRDSIIFLVLDTEYNATGLKKSFIIGEQLEMLKNVCDTISKSRFLIVLHGRLLWMIGDDYFNEKLDSVAESTRQLDSTNFYLDVFPQLQKAKSKGIKVICLGGDKSKINIEYSPEDSITFYTSTMAPEFTDSVNNVLIFSYNKITNKLTREFVPLSIVEKNPQDPVSVRSVFNEEMVLKIWQEMDSKKIGIQLQGRNDEKVLIHIYSISGILCESINLTANEKTRVRLNSEGIYIIKAISGKSLITEKIIVW